MIRPQVNLERYNYKFSNVYINSPRFSEPIIVTNNFISSFNIINDYDNAVSPAMSLDLTLRVEDHLKVQSNMSSITVSFTIYKMYLGVINDDNKNTPNMAENAQEVEYLNLNLKAVNQDSIDTSYTSESEANKTRLDERNENIETLKLYLYDNKKLLNYRRYKSYIIVGTANDLIYNFFRDRDMDKLIVTSAVDNTKRNYCVPYGHLGDNIKTLNEMYGIYDYPYLFYMGLDRNYLIDKKNVGKTLERNELGAVNIYLERREVAGMEVTGCYKDEENGMYILNAPKFQVNDNDSMVDYSLAGKVTTVLSGTNIRYTNVIGDYDVEKSYVINNPHMHKQILYNIQETKRSVIIEFTNIDLSIITPNKAYYVIPDEVFYSSEYEISGRYRLAGSNIIFTGDSENTFTCGIQLVLKKIFDI